MIMNTQTKLGLASLAAVLAVSMPTSSHAKENPALNRCVELFIQEVVPADYPVEIRKESIAASTIDLNGVRSKVTLLAYGENESKILGRASCVLHRNGTLVSMYLHASKFGQSKVLARNLDAKQGLRTAFADETKAF
jgi:hypothetical protein